MSNALDAHTAHAGGFETASETHFASDTLGTPDACHRKQTSDLEVEVFVHGALCMCYSGQCQMSRLLGAKSAGALSNLSGSTSMGQSGKISSGHLDNTPSARSGNRGLCAQPCRLPYTDDKGRTEFWLSPKDICTIQRIPELITAGVDSFKIEGRLKSPEYVATVTRIYRKYIDLYMKLCREEKASLSSPTESATTQSITLPAALTKPTPAVSSTVTKAIPSGWKIEPEDMHDLTQIFNRGGFTTGYLDGNPRRNILSGDSPKNQGIYVGAVCNTPKEIRGNSGTKNKMLIDVKLADQIDESNSFRSDSNILSGGTNSFRDESIHLGCNSNGFHDDSDTFHGKTKSSDDEPIHLGDGVEIRAGKRDKFHRSNNMPNLFTTGNVVTYLKPLGGGKIRIGDFDKGIHEGDKVYKVTDKELNAKALKTPSKKLPVSMKFEAEIGKQPVLEISEIIPFKSDVVKVNGDFVTQKALNKPTDPTRIAEQISKLGDTTFETINVQVNVDDEIMIPVSVMNQMRRDAVKKLLDNKRFRRTLPAITCNKSAFVKFANTAKENFAETVCEGFAEGDRKNLVKKKKTLIPIEQFMKELDSETVTSSSCNESVLPYILNVSKGELDKYIEDNFDAIVAATKSTGILIGNLGWIKQFLDAGITVYGDYGLNAYNNECVKAFEELGIKIMRMSHETATGSSYAILNNVSGVSVGCIAGKAANDTRITDKRFDGRIPLMITEHPLETDYLIDRKGAKHDVLHLGDKHLIF